jgi:hypothetical protein
MGEEASRRMNERKGSGAVNRRAIVGVLALATIAVLGMALLAAVGGSAVRTVAIPNSHAEPAYIPGDYITYTCTNSKITTGSTTICNNQGITIDSCDSSVCTLSVTDTPAGTHVFNHWTTSGDAYIGASGSGCSSTTTSTSNPITLCMLVPNSGGKYGGTLTATVV